MKWSWKIGEFRGIGVYLHATFLILIGFVVVSHWSAGSNLGKTLEGMGFILALFGGVLLHEFLGYTRATQIAANIGQAMPLVFGFPKFFFNPFLLFIALFVRVGAAQEATMTQMNSSLASIPVRRTMITTCQTFTPHDPSARSIERILTGSQQDFPVVDGGEVVGIPIPPIRLL